ncbi:MULTISPECIES: contact-dependent growth inhibition system immunity protein [Streptomyces]|uniref:Uncharacterized protein n=1 Tax=Streptomyces virens TaxID=285572 RepID=A0ABP6PVV5_9ACTN|nr:contact-dependent growth inhibition system immunity protein [Streptomyces calvus]MBA8975124.1 hypothetical protein [Streptomyces calvus]
MLAESVDKEKSLEELEGVTWPDPPSDSTMLVRGVHELRKKPVKDLTVDNLRRLVGQDVGLRWLLPVALDFLRETAKEEGETGWYDDDLLSAVLTRKESTWRSFPKLARHLDGTVRLLSDLSPYLQRDVRHFRDALADIL